MILCMLSLSETLGLNSIVTVPVICVWSTLYGPLVCSSNVRGSNVLSSVVEGGNHIVSFSDFLV
jgi:hypothetical protein